MGGVMSFVAPTPRWYALSAWLRVGLKTSLQKAAPKEPNHSPDY
jgi:hypothetical protein